MSNSALYISSLVGDSVRYRKKRSVPLAYMTFIHFLEIVLVFITGISQLKYKRSLGYDHILIVQLIFSPIIEEPRYAK
jgi:hypothetical protein